MRISDWSSDVCSSDLPTCISFNVTPKIDSRTILGEAGAEQLLGKGDLLYVPGGKQITPSHRPFASDAPVRAVAAHWRGQSSPAYVDSVTADPEHGGFRMEEDQAGRATATDRLDSRARPKLH